LRIAHREEADAQCCRSEPAKDARKPRFAAQASDFLSKERDFSV
jgi:hypothetical protein